MSLIKQLWLAVILLMALTFSASAVISVLSARQYLQQQLQMKNIDNATALALSLTQLPKDRVLLELHVAAQFDAGHYRFIRLRSPGGQTLVERVYGDMDGKEDKDGNGGDTMGAPAWFASLIPISVQPGQALVQDQWQQYGVLTLASQEQYAYQSLWQGTWELLLWFAVAGLCMGLAGSLYLRFITRSLQAVVGQAEAINQRRFTYLPEPRTPELRALARGMNDMVARLKTLFSEEAARLDALRKKVNGDAVTGLSSREYFLAHLQEVLRGEHFSSSGSLVLLRLKNLDVLNATLGHQTTDSLLKDVGDALNACGAGPANAGNVGSGDTSGNSSNTAASHDSDGYRAGRLKGAEFAVIFPGHTSALAAAQQIAQCLQKQVLPRWAGKVSDLFYLGAVCYASQQSAGSLLSSANQALAKAACKGPNSIEAQEDPQAQPAWSSETWRSLLTEAMEKGHLVLNYFPVLAGDGKTLLHHEGMIRLKTDAAGSLMTAGDFMPMAAQLHLTAPLDLGVIKMAIGKLLLGSGDVAVNLATETIADTHFHSQLALLLTNAAHLCPRLWFEVPEYGLFRQLPAFSELARTLKAHGCRVGVEYFGQQLAQLHQLAALALDYIKVHPDYVHGIADNPGKQEFLQSLCKVAHTMGITVIALGVEQAEDLALLARLGFDGGTGRGVG